MKKIIIMLILVLSLSFTIALVGCADAGKSGNTATSGDGTSPAVNSGEVDFSLLTLKKLTIKTDSPKTFVMGEVDLSKVVIVCTYVDESSNEHTKEILLDDTMISDADRQKFNVVSASSTVTVTYSDKTVQYTFTIKESTNSSLYTVSFEANGGDTILSRKERELTYIEVPVRAGYKFLGWYDNVYCLGTTVVASASAPYTLTKDITLYAKWEDNRNYKVEFLDINDEVIEAYTKRIVHGEDVPVPLGPIVEGYKFISWDGQFENIQSDQQISSRYETVVLEVVFYTYDYQGPNEDTKTMYVNYGDSLDYSQIIPQKKDGNTVEWKIYNEQSGKYLPIIDQFSEVKSNYRVVPVYTRISYNITFADGGAALDTTLGISKWESIVVPVFWGERFDIKSNVTANYNIPKARMGHIAYWTIYDRQTDCWKNIENGLVWNEEEEKFISGTTTTNYELKYRDNSTGITYTTAEVNFGDLVSVRDNISIKAVYTRETYTLAFKRSTADLAVIYNIPFYSNVCLYSDLPKNERDGNVIYGDKTKKYFLKYPNENDWDIEWYTNTQDTATRPTDGEVVFLDDDGDYHSVIVTKNTNYYCADIDLRSYSVDFFGYNFTTEKSFLISSFTGISYGTTVVAPTTDEVFQNTDSQRFYYSVNSTGAGISWYSVPQSYPYDSENISIGSISSNLTLYAHYQRRTYNVTYIDNKYPYTKTIFDGTSTYKSEENGVTQSISDANELTVVMNASYSVLAGEHVPTDKIFFGGDQTVRIIDEYINGYLEKLNTFVTIDGEYLTYINNFGTESKLTYRDLIKGIYYNGTFSYNFNYLNYFSNSYKKYYNYSRFIEIYEAGLAAGYDLQEIGNTLDKTAAATWWTELEYIMTSIFGEPSYANWRTGRENAGYTDNYKYVYYLEFYVALMDINGDGILSSNTDVNGDAIINEKDNEKTYNKTVYLTMREEFGRLMEENSEGYNPAILENDFTINGNKLPYEINEVTYYLSYRDVQNNRIYDGILTSERTNYITEDFFDYYSYFHKNYVNNKNYYNFVDIYDKGISLNYPQEESAGTLDYLSAADWWNDLEYIMTSKFSYVSYETWRAAKTPGVDDFKYLYYEEFYISILDIDNNGVVSNEEKENKKSEFATKRNEYLRLCNEYTNGYANNILDTNILIEGHNLSYLDGAETRYLKYSDVKNGVIYQGIFDAEWAEYRRDFFDYEQYFIEMQTYYYECSDWIVNYEAGLAAYWDLYEEWEPTKLQSATDWVVGLEDKMVNVFGSPSYESWKMNRTNGNDFRYLYYKEFYTQLLDINGDGVLTNGDLDLNGDGACSIEDNERNIRFNYYLAREDEYRSLNLDIFNYGNPTGTNFKNYYNNEDRKVYYELLYYNTAEDARLDSERVPRYTFGGWYTSATLTTEYTPIDKKITSDGVNIYTKWIDQRIGTLGLIFELIEDSYTPEEGDYCYRVIDYVSKAEYESEYAASSYSANRPENAVMEDIIEIPKGHQGLPVREISASAFFRKNNVTNITSITVASTISLIEAGAFELCENLMVISIAKGNTVYGVGSEGAVYKGIYQINGDDEEFIPEELVCYPAKVTLEADKSHFVADELIGSFSYICNDASGNPTINISIGISRKDVESNVYRDTFILPDTVTIIQSKAFACANNLRYIGFSPNTRLREISEKSFCGLVVEKVGLITYDGLANKYIVGTVLPSTIVSIGSEAFRESTNIAQISYNGTALLTVGTNAFFRTGWYNLLSSGNEIISIGGVALGCGVNYFNNGVTKLTLENNIYAVADEAFLKKTDIVEIIIKNTNFKRIGMKAFSGCSKVESLSIYTIDGSTVDFGEPPTSVLDDWAESPFAGWKTLNFHIPSGVLESYRSGDWAVFNGADFVTFIDDLS